MTCALIAIKARAQCKSRLAAVLPSAARLDLVRGMLDAVLSAARGARSLRQVVVVSPERDCIPADIPVLADAGVDLNVSLAAAQRVLHGFGSDELLVLPADLPRITAADIDELVGAGQGSGFAIAPDALGTGTNALYLRTPRPFRFRFGLDSAHLHLEQARIMGLGTHVIHRSGLEFDVDSADDLRHLEEPVWKTA